MTMARALPVALLAAVVQTTVPSPFAHIPPQQVQFAAVRASRYLPMRDGVRLAVETLRDRAVPAARAIPAIVRFTRYGRMPAQPPPTDVFWAVRGYAIVAVDQRGTGASFGHVRYGAAELGDMRTVLDWVVAQPWSNGRVAAIGTSYEGTTAELLAATGHPAVRAVAPLYSDWDYYDLFRPGGILNEGLAAGFSHITAEMDAGSVATPVDGDANKTLMREAIAEHAANPNLEAALRENEYSDDAIPQLGGTESQLATRGSRDALERAHIPETVVASWYDAAIAEGALDRYTSLNVPQRLVIGATNHGGHRIADPFRPPAPNTDGTLGDQYRLAEELFNARTKDAAPQTAPSSITYFTTGENVWKQTSTWPPPGRTPQEWYLAPNSRLAPAQTAGTSTLALPVAVTGPHNRWYSQMTGEDVSLREIAQGVAGAPAFTTDPLTTAVEITGKPVLRLAMTSSIADPSLIAFLLAVAPDGTATTLTQGELRLIHRKLDQSSPWLHTFARRDLQPIAPGSMLDVTLALHPFSTTVPAGYRLRLALAAGEQPALETAGPYQTTLAPTSTLTLPIRPRADLTAPPRP